MLSHIFEEHYQNLSFEKLESQFPVEQHFQQQAQASFPELTADSTELLFSEYKRFWLDRSGYQQSLQKWMSHWISRVEKKQHEYLQRQQRLAEKQRSYSNYPNTTNRTQSTTYQSKQHNVEQWRTYGQRCMETTPTVIDGHASSTMPNIGFLEEMGYA